MGNRRPGNGYMSTHGYRLQSLGKGGKEYEHRVIAAKVLGRTLLQCEEVHHVDGDRSNNTHSNLVICTRATHRHIHFLTRLKRMGHSRETLKQLHHADNLPLEEIKRRLNVGKGMMGRWFKKLNIEIRPGIPGKGSLKYQGYFNGD